MPDPRKDPLRNFRFTVECDGLVAAGFSDVSGYDMSVDVIEYRSGSEEITPRKLPGLRKHGNITLKRGEISDPEMYAWINTYAGEGKAEVVRKNIKISILNEKGESSAEWQVLKAWPIKYSISDLKGTGNEVLVETLEIAHEEMKRVK